MHYISDILIKFIILGIITILFFRYGSYYLKRIAIVCSYHVPLTNKWPLSKVENSISFVLITLAQLGFMFLLLIFTNTPWGELNFSYTTTLALDGVLLGISIIGVSSFICQDIIPMLSRAKLFTNITSNIKSKAFIKNGLSQQLNDSKDIFPIYICLLLIFMKALSDEVIFRGAYIHYFSHHDRILPILLSTILFIITKVFFIKPRIHNIFSTTTIITTGLAHGYFYALIPSLFPLIISQCVIYLFIFL